MQRGYRNLDLPLILSVSLRVVRFPESEVGDLLLIVFIIVYADTRYQPLHIEICELSIFPEFAHTIVYTSIIGEVGVSLPHESIDDRSHIRDELGYRLHMICRDDTELRTVSDECFCIVLCELLQALSGFLTITYRLIIDISHTHDVAYSISEIPQ